MYLNLIYLKYFCDAVKFGGISASARNNFVTQSAISQGIKKLEGYLKTPLVEHHPNRFKLTHEGEMIYQNSHKVFQSVIELEEVLQTGEVTGHIEFACTYSFALARLPEMVKTFKEKFPHIPINFRLAHADVIKSWIRNHVVDFGIVLDNEDFSAFDSEEVLEGYHRPYKSKKLKNIDGLPWIFSEDRSEVVKFKQEYPIENFMEVQSWEVIANLTEEGVGVGFFPDYVAEKKKGLVPVEVGVEPIPYKILAIHTKPLSKASKSFLSL